MDNEQERALGRAMRMAWGHGTDSWLDLSEDERAAWAVHGRRVLRLLHRFGFDLRPHGDG